MSTAAVSVERAEYRPAPTALPDRHLPQLDGIRCVAVLLVIWHHTHPDVYFGLQGIGMYGVWVFFVLSAFLITRILLGQRERMRENDVTLGESLRTFYGRRALRILPAYLALLALNSALGIPRMTGELQANLLFVTNWFFNASNYFPFVNGHLWSLAIEEQFYLVWPLLVFTLPRRMLRPLLVAAVAWALIVRGQGFLGARWERYLEYTTPANLDVFAIGAWLALRWEEDRPPRLAWACWIGLALWILVGVLTYTAGFLRVFLLIEPLAAALLGAWLVNAAALGFGGWPGRGLRWAPIAYLGSISYGLYLFHMAPLWTLDLVHQSGAAAWAVPGTWPYAIAVFAAALGLAWLSARYIERPALSLKRYLPYNG